MPKLSQIEPLQLQAAILDEAWRWVGTPYHHAARILGAGVDCAMLLYAVYVDGLGLVDPFTIDDYPHDWMLHREQERFLSHILSRADEVTEPEPGDIVLYRVGRCYAHAAIVVSWPTVIHADMFAGRVTAANGTQGHLARPHRFFRVQTSALPAEVCP